MTANRSEGDFGLTGLTHRFHEEWGRDSTAQELVARSAAEGGGVNAYAIRADVARLLGSRLPDTDLTALWQAATGRRYNLEYLGIGIRDWLGEVAAICAERSGGPVPAPGPAGPGEQAVADAVLDELRLAGPALAAATESRIEQEVAGVVPALESALGEVGPDLTFRLFLRAMGEYWVSIDRAQYDRYRSLGERLGHGELHVNDVDFLVDLDA
ncbi:hypothetical protein [Kitasatospora sp. NPDC093679]|uniref:hypothetical protein n=1 Tax=Kitasatospora sp. NPDC093679 TaxID=3154983 RepID=UPI003413FFC3